jgi:hypothetical protein
MSTRYARETKVENKRWSIGLRPGPKSETATESLGARKGLALNSPQPQSCEGGEIKHSSGQKWWRHQQG